MARRKYSDEYKQEAVALTRVPGATITAVAADLGINSHMLGKWRKAMEQLMQEEQAQMKDGTYDYGFQPIDSNPTKI